MTDGGGTWCGYLWEEGPHASCCYRSVWDDRNQCIWHAEANGKDDKPIELLQSVRESDENQRRNRRGETPAELLDGVQLSGLKFGDALSFDRCSLRDADFSKANLEGAILSDADLQGADFSGAIIRHADFSKANMRATLLIEVDLGAAVLTGAYLREADLSKANLWRADLSGADLGNVALAESDLKNARLSEAMLWGSDLSMTTLQGADLSEADLRDADLSKADLQTANLSRANLRNADLPGANLAFANLREAHLGGVDLSGADLSGADLSGGDLQGANLSGANLKGVDLSKANLRSADLSGTDIREANLKDAMLEDAVLAKADCRGTDFRGARLYETVLIDTRINSATKFIDPGSTTYSLCVYEQQPDKPLDEYDVLSIEAAVWMYRRLELLHEDSAMADSARRFHVLKEEAQRKQYLSQFEQAVATSNMWSALSPGLRYTVSTLNFVLTEHGENLARLVGWALFIVVGSGLLYPFVGGIEEAGTRYCLVGRACENSQLIVNMAKGLYFSIITFTTIGYVNVAPVGIGSRILVGFESLTGAVLIVLFVYVLGRQMSR